MAPLDPQQDKHKLRAAAHLRRLHLQDGSQKNRQIVDSLTALPEYSGGKTVLCYVSFRTEVATLDLLARMINEGKRVVVPYCEADRLELFHFIDFADLAPRTLGILEPKPELRALEDRHVPVRDIDLFVLPGLAFDRDGGRLGYGKGYFDRLLKLARPDALLAAIAFECQLFDAIPMTPQDIRVDAVVTESNVYRRTLPRVGGEAR
jgi:5-formyltetrahydrofolate cyclo-ligase